MSIRRKGKQWQADVMIHGTRHRKSFSLAKDAENWEEELKRRKSLGLDISELVNDAVEITLDEAMEKTWSKYWRGTDSDYGNYQKMKEVMTFFPRGMYLSELSTSKIDTFMDWLEEKGNAAATINNKLNILSKTVNWAVTRGHIDLAPKIERKKLTQGKPKFFSDEELYGIRAILHDPATQDIVRGLPNSLVWDYMEFGLESGMRSSEMTNLSVSKQVRVDPNLGKVIDLEETKNELYRCNPLTAKMEEILTKYEEVDQPFKKITQKTRWKVWNHIRVMMDTQDEEWIMYLTRHTCASRLVQAGVNLLAVKKYMGHKKIETTMRYASIRPDDLIQCTDALNIRQPTPKIELKSA